MNITEFRQKYPMYDKLSDTDLSDRLYQKYYADKLPKEEFLNSFVDPAYPQHETTEPSAIDTALSKIKSVGGTIKNSIEEAIQKVDKSNIDFVNKQQAQYEAQRATLPPVQQLQGTETRGFAPQLNSFKSRGNIDIFNRPVHKNKDGSISTVRSISFNEDGKEILIPTISDNGQLLTLEQAIDLYHKTGKYLGKFNSVAEADKYAVALHKQQAALYEQKKPKHVSSKDIAEFGYKLLSGVAHGEFLPERAKPEEGAAGFTKNMLIGVVALPTYAAQLGALIGKDLIVDPLFPELAQHAKIAMEKNQKLPDSYLGRLWQGAKDTGAALAGIITQFIPGINPHVLQSIYEYPESIPIGIHIGKKFKDFVKAKGLKKAQLADEIKQIVDEIEKKGPEVFAEKYAKELSTPEVHPTKKNMEKLQKKLAKEPAPTATSEIMKTIINPVDKAIKKLDTIRQKRPEQITGLAEIINSTPDKIIKAIDNMKKNGRPETVIEKQLIENVIPERRAVSREQPQPVPESGKINAITRKEAGQLIAEGKPEVIPHIKEGLASGRLTPKEMQDTIRNQVLREIAKAPKEKRAGIKANYKRLQPEIDKVLKGENITEPAKGAVVSGTLPVSSTEGGYVKLPRAKKIINSFKEFWSPLSTLKKSIKFKELRGKQLGGINRVERIVEKTWKRTKNLSPELKHDLFRFLDGEISKDVLPKKIRSLAIMLRTQNNLIGKMLVKRGLLDEKTFERHKNQYVRYLYLKHILGDESNIPIGQSGKLDLSYLENRKDLTKEQRKAIGLIEDVSVAQPMGLSKALGDIVKHDYMEKIVNNPDWTWQPSIIDVDGKKMGIGQLTEEVKIARQMYEQAPNVPEIKQRLDKLENALNKAINLTKNAPEDFTQLPTSKSYGPLAGAFVAKPIARDIMPVFSGFSSASNLSKIINTVMKIEEKGMAAFKVGKVAYNLPTIIRNMGSNVLQLNMSGMPLWDIPIYMAKAAKHMLKQDNVYQQALRHGIFKTNWGVAEIGEVLDAVRTMRKKSYPDIFRGLSQLAKYYGKIDDFFKMSKYIEQIEKGKGAGRAAIEAQKWGMDYSLADPSVKFARRHFIPFLSYQYKIAPLIAESLIKRPWVIAKYMAIPSLMVSLAKHQLHISDDEWKRLKKSLPLFVRKNKTLLILPWKSPEGNLQWVDYQYFLPWGNWMELAGSIKDKDVKKTIEGLGIGNPFMDIYTAFKSAKGETPPKDPYSGIDMYNQLDSPETKAEKTLEWLYNKWAPSMLTRFGALGYSTRIGKKDKYGRTITFGQAMGRWFGINIFAPTSKQAILEKKYKIRQARTSLAKILKDSTKSKEEKRNARKRYIEEIRRIQNY